METAIQKRIENGMSFEQMRERASLLVKSGFLPTAVSTPEKALTIMLTGQELGLGFMESLRSINVIQGKPCMSAQLLIALCYRTKEVEQAYVKESNEKRAIYILKRKGQPAFESIFTIEDANKAKFSMAWDKEKQEWKVKDNWQKQPATMLLWRSMARAARFVFPDAMCGLYTPEEIAEGVDVAENPQSGEVEVTEIHETKPAAEEIPEKQIEGPGDCKAEDIPDDQLGNWIVPMGKYAGMRLVQVAAQVTDTGKNVGLEWLEKASETAKDPKAREIIARFVSILTEK